MGGDSTLSNPKDEVEAAGTRFRDEEQRETATAATLARGGGAWDGVGESGRQR